jgi:hypothetical protein
MLSLDSQGGKAASQCELPLGVEIACLFEVRQ